MAGHHDGRSDRLWLAFAVSSVAFVGVLAISPVKDYFREYRAYQTAYRQKLLDGAGSAQELKAASALTVGIRQFFIPEFDRRVDRCTSCHLGVENAKMAGAPEPFRSHPLTPHTPGDFDRFGCVSCHLGQGRATSVAEAHGDVADWSSPLLPVRYTEASCGRCHAGDAVPEASLLSRGRALMTRAGCFGCHRMRGHEGWRSEAPDLDGLSAKTYPAWIAAWLKSPSSLREGTLMPDFHLPPEEIEPLVAFLWARPPRASRAPAAGDVVPAGDAARGKTLFGESRCVSCHTIEGRGNGSAPELSGVASKVNRRWLIEFLADPEALQPATRMPRYAFSRQDLLDLSQYLMDEMTDNSAPAPGPPIHPSQKAIAEGEAVYKKYGCGGCHRLSGRGDAAPTGPDLTGIGDKAVALIDFGVRDDLPRRLPDYLAAKVTAPRSFREGLRMPEFKLTGSDTEAIVTALLSAGRDSVPQAYRVESPDPHDAPPGRFGALVSRYRCLSCHQVQGAGGDISNAPLTFEGSRVKRDWLLKYLLLPSTIRPILTDRMIPLRMPQEEAAFLADFMENVYVDNDTAEEIFSGGLPAAQVERGRTLFHERFGCRNCHMVDGKGGYYGPLLDGAGSRLKSGFVFRWLKGPQRWRADVRCADFGLADDDARDLAAYVMSIPPPPAAAGASKPAGSAR
ncbi:MAG: c-type cytochrome [Acidobacteria bacterium]|nr:c-type cytochrome [Acidobacteriota bacterium]